MNFRKFSFLRFQSPVGILSKVSVRENSSSLDLFAIFFNFSFLSLILFLTVPPHQFRQILFSFVEIGNILGVAILVKKLS